MSGAGSNNRGSQNHIAADLARAGVTAEERYQLISKSAYLRAESRGFAPGAELQDWLAAEAEVDDMLGNMAAANQTKDRSPMVRSRARPGRQS